MLSKAREDLTAPLLGPKLHIKANYRLLVNNEVPDPEEHLKEGLEGVTSEGNLLFGD